MTTPKAVVFDLGNVLIRWDPHPAVAATLGDEEAALFLDGFDFMAWNHRQDLGRSFEEAEAELAGTHPHWHPHALAYRDNFGLSLSAMTDNVAVLRDLHAAGTPVFALTNWSAELFPQALARFDFLGLFEDIVVSGAERLAKPDPEVYALLERRVRRPLTECAFVDDSPANVDAAREAGLDAFLLTERVSLRQELRDRGLPV